MENSQVQVRLGDIIQFMLTDEEKKAGKFPIKPVVVYQMQNGVLGVIRGELDIDHLYSEEQLNFFMSILEPQIIEGDTNHVRSLIPISALDREVEMIVELQEYVNTKINLELVRRFPEFKGLSSEEAVREANKKGLEFSVNYYEHEGAPVIDIRILKEIDRHVYKQEIHISFGESGFNYKIVHNFLTRNYKRRMGDR